MAITLNTTATVTTPVTKPVQCDSGWVQASTVDGSSLSLANVGASFSIRPYKSNACQISGSAINDGTATVTTVSPHGFVVGQSILITDGGVGFVYTNVASVPSPTSFTIVAAPGIPGSPIAASSPVFSDQAALVVFATKNAMGAAKNIPEIGAYVAAMEAMGTALVAYQALRQADVAAATTALATAQTAATASVAAAKSTGDAAIATAQADVAAKTAAVQAAQVSNPTNSVDDIAARKAARAALDDSNTTLANARTAAANSLSAAQAAATASLVTPTANLAAAKAALADFANPPVVLT